jgi:hypothetical protein
MSYINCSQPFRARGTIISQIVCRHMHLDFEKDQKQKLISDTFNDKLSTAHLCVAEHWLRNADLHLPGDSYAHPQNIDSLNREPSDPKEILSLSASWKVCLKYASKCFVDFLSDFKIFNISVLAALTETE